LGKVSKELGIGLSRNRMLRCSRTPYDDVHQHVSEEGERRKVKEKDACEPR